MWYCMMEPLLIFLAVLYTIQIPTTQVVGYLQNKMDQLCGLCNHPANLCSDNYLTFLTKLCSSLLSICLWITLVFCLNIETEHYRLLKVLLLEWPHLEGCIGLLQAISFIQYTLYSSTCLSCSWQLCFVLQFKHEIVELKCTGSMYFSMHIHC